MSLDTLLKNYYKDKFANLEYNFKLFYVLIKYKYFLESNMSNQKIFNSLLTLEYDHSKNYH